MIDYLKDIFDLDYQSYFDYLDNVFVNVKNFNIGEFFMFLNDNLNMIITLMFIFWFFITEFYLRKKIKRTKSDINKKYSSEELEEIDRLENLDQDLFIEYYKWKNILNLIRFLIIFSWASLLVLFKAPWIFNFMAIALWAIIITFKEIILSFVSFFYISTHYKIWENIVLWDHNNIIRWEIIYINILNIWIIWKSDNWEHNWQFYTIPNYKLFIENVRKEELSVNKYRKEEIEIFYKNDLFRVNFDEFLDNLKEFLDFELVKKNINNIWNYKTYIWYKYKMRFKYDKDYLIIKIYIIEKHKASIILQNKIISFVESQKKDVHVNQEQIQVQE